MRNSLQFAWKVIALWNEVFDLGLVGLCLDFCRLKLCNDLRQLRLDRLIPSTQLQDELRRILGMVCHRHISTFRLLLCSRGKQGHGIYVGDRSQHGLSLQLSL